MSKELFKTFVRKHPELGNEVIKNNVSWQKLYELYEMYGEESDIWDNYYKNNRNNFESKESSIYELINMIKKIDLDSVQKGVNSLQKTIGLLQDIGIGNKERNVNYEARPLYKRFDD